SSEFSGDAKTSISDNPRLSPSPSVTSKRTHSTTFGGKVICLGSPLLGMVVTVISEPSLNFNLPPAVCSSSLGRSYNIILLMDRGRSQSNCTQGNRICPQAILTPSQAHSPISAIRIIPSVSPSAV